jgi:hypothetical protein
MNGSRFCLAPRRNGNLMKVSATAIVGRRNVVNEEDKTERSEIVTETRKLLIPCSHLKTQLGRENWQQPRQIAFVLRALPTIL